MKIWRSQSPNQKNNKEKIDFPGTLLLSGLDRFQ
jgi:hypothetical protein